MTTKQEAITAANRADFITTTLGIDLSTKQDTIAPANKASVLSALGLTDVVTTLDSKLHTSGIVSPLTLKTASGAVTATPQLTLWHNSTPTDISRASLEMKTRNSSVYTGYHEAGVRQIYEYNNNDTGEGRTAILPPVGRFYYQFIDRIGTATASPLSTETVEHTGPSFYSDGIADFAGGNLTGVASIQATGTITCNTLAGTQSSLSVNTDLWLPNISGVPKRMYMFDSFAWLGHGSSVERTSDGTTTNIGDGGPTLSSYNGGSLSWSWNKASYDGIPQAALKWSDQGIDVSGAIKLDGAPFTSDDRLKDDEESLETAGINSIGVLSRLTPLIYTKKRRSDLSVMGPEVGLIAHDTWNVLRDHPKLCRAIVSGVDEGLEANFDSSGDLLEDHHKRDVDGDEFTGSQSVAYLGINYLSLVPLLIDAINKMNVRLEVAGI